MLDALDAQPPAPGLVVEVGPGSGCVLTAAASKRGFGIGVDRNPAAAWLTTRTARTNGVLADAVVGDFCSCLRPSVADMMIFNPPYVPTEDDEVQDVTAAAYAGGDRGRRVIDRFINDPSVRVLADKGAFFFLLEERNCPEEVVAALAAVGLRGELVSSRKVPGERLTIWRFVWGQ